MGTPVEPIGPRRLAADAGGQVVAAVLDLESGDGVVLEVGEQTNIELARLPASEGEQVFIEAVITSPSGAPLVIGGWRLSPDRPVESFVKEVSSDGGIDVATLNGRRIFGGVRLSPSSVLLVGDEPAGDQFTSFAVRVTDGEVEEINLDTLGVPAAGLSDVAPFDAGVVFLTVDPQSPFPTMTTVCSQALLE